MEKTDPEDLVDDVIPGCGCTEDPMRKGTSDTVIRIERGWR